MDCTKQEQKEIKNHFRWSLVKRKCGHIVGVNLSIAGWFTFTMPQPPSKSKDVKMSKERCMECNKVMESKDLPKYYTLCQRCRAFINQFRDLTRKGRSA